MKRRLLFSLIFLAVSFIAAVSVPKAFASCPPANAAKTYSQSGGTCYPSTGLGFNTTGGKYAGCGPVSCPGSSSSPHGNTCIYSESGGKCFAGYGAKGFNPSGAEGGCTYNSADNGTPITCPSHFSFTSEIKDSSGKVITTGVTEDVYDNGRTFSISPDSTGTFTLRSWSGNHIKVTPKLTSNSSATFTPATIQGYMNQQDSLKCGTQLGDANGNPGAQNPNGPCIFTTSSGGGGGGGGPTADLTLVLGLPGIGYNGPAGVTPKHTSRSITVTLYASGVADPSGPGTTPLATPSAGTLTYDGGSDSNAGYFVGKIKLNLPTTPPAGNTYEILVQAPQYLYKLAVNAADSTTTFTLTSGSSVTSSPLILFPGDVAIGNGALNHLNGDDYTVMLNCFANPSSCPTTADGIPLADLDDDPSSTIDIIDLNIWLRSLFGLIQAQAPGCSNADCQGD